MSQGSNLTTWQFQNIPGSQLLSDIQTFFSWEPALETLNSQDADEEDVKKKALQFSALNSDFWA